MTDTDPFSNPAAASGIDWSALNGALLLFKVGEQEKGIKTAFGESDAIRCNLSVLDGDQADTLFDDILVFPKVLQSQLRSKTGELVLGRLGQGEKKAGQDPPWKLADPTDADKVIGRAYLEKNKPAPPF